MKLKRLSQREGATLFMMLLAAFKTLLYRYTAQTDLLIGVPIANRNRAEVEGLIGLFVNTIILRTDLSDDPTFLQLLARVREAALGAYANQDLPFEKLAEELQPERDLSRTPIFQVMFSLQNVPKRERSVMPGLTIAPFPLDVKTSKFELTLTTLEDGEGVTGVWEYNTDAFDFSVWEIWGALLYGGRLVVTPYLVSRSPQSFYQLLGREQVTVLNQTPSAFRQLMQVDEDQQGGSGLALRLVIFGGEALDPAALKPWVSRHGYDLPRLVNMYGITETTVHVTYRPLVEDDVVKNAGSFIGAPIPDLRLYLLDRRAEPAGKCLTK